MEKNLQKVLQVSLENLFFTSQKILKHHGKKKFQKVLQVS
jgi:hypothetical protein